MSEVSKVYFLTNKIKKAKAMSTMRSIHKKEAELFHPYSKNLKTDNRMLTLTFKSRMMMRMSRYKIFLVRIRVRIAMLITKFPTVLHN